jgi:hypothetical protein
MIKPDFSVSLRGDGPAEIHVSQKKRNIGHPAMRDKRRPDVMAGPGDSVIAMT